MALENTVGLTIKEVKKLKKDCEEEVRNIIEGFENRTRVRVDGIETDKGTGSYSSFTFNCKL